MKRVKRRKKSIENLPFVSLLNLYPLPTHDGILKSIRDSVYNDIRFPRAI